MNRALKSLTLACAVLLGSGPSLLAQILRPGQPVLPEVALAASVRGEAAVSALGDKLPGVAAHYGMTAEKLAGLFRSDGDLWADRKGRLFFAESHLPDPTLAPAGSEKSTTQLALVPIEQTFFLHSRPSATKKIYLDFTGHTTTGTSWTDYTDADKTFVTPVYDFDGNAASFSTSELERIQYIWQRVTEDYAVFDVDVTTEDPGVEGLRKTTTSDVNYGIRVCIGGDSRDWYSSTCCYGGVAYIGSFDWNSDTPCYVWENNLGNGNEKYVAEAISHEIGHTLDLYHDGTSTAGYYEGHGTGADGWAPIMGVGYYQPVVQFSRGEYADANNTEDDFAKITATFNIAYLTDDYGNDFATATPISSGAVQVDGQIGRNTDVDYFSFEAGAGDFVINVAVDSRSPNLNVEATLYNGLGQVVAVSSPAASLTASLNLPGMPAGTYFLKIEGVGSGDPLNTGYSDYGSIGIYSIRGTLPSSGAPNAVATATPISGVSPLTVQFSSSGSTDSNGSIVAYAWTFGDGGTSTEANPSYTYFVAGSFTATLVVTDNDGFTGAAAVLITVQGPPSPPTGLTADPTCNADPSLGAVAMSWQDTAFNEDSFRIEGSADNGANWTLSGTVGTGITSFTHTSLSTGATYLYRVRAENGFGVSAWSAVDSATTFAIPAGPPTLTAAPVSSSQISLAWPSTPNSTGYRIERTANANLSGFALIASPAAGTTTYTDGGLNGGTPYYYRIIATGACSFLTAPSGVASATTLPAPPAAPSSLTARAASKTQINLSWRDNAGDEAGIYVERSPDGNSGWLRIATLGANTTSYANTGLVANTLYYYRVQAFKSGGLVSAYSNTDSVRTKR